MLRMRGHSRSTSSISRDFLSHLLHSCNEPNSASRIHSLLLKKGLLHSTDCYFSTKLCSLYGKLGSSGDARKLFDETPHPTTLLWNALFRSHCRSQQWETALLLFHRMNYVAPVRQKPDRFTLSIALKSCAGVSNLLLGKAVHALVAKGSDEVRGDMFVGAAMVEMYSECGETSHALRVFEQFRDPDVGLWTSVVTGYLQNGNAEMAVSFFSRMVVEKSASPNQVTLASLVSAVGQLGSVRAGRSCHGFVIRTGFDLDTPLLNSLLNCYAKLGYVGIARKLFDTMLKKDVITWSCMVACYSHNGKADEALEVYKGMFAVGLKPNSVTVVSALQACALAFSLEEGRRIHKLAVHKGFASKLAVSTALVDMYMKCGCCKEALGVFHGMPKQDVVTWASLIGGYVQNGFANESLEAFNGMLFSGTRPDAVIMVKVLGACSQLGILRQALCFHGFIVRNGFNNKVFVGAALVDLYSKCGSLDSAIQVFEMAGDKDVVLWSSMIAGYGIHGLGRTAIAMFECMIKSSIWPNSLTFVSILSACSHAGLVEDGRRIFGEMTCVYGIEPVLEHYTVMVDLFGRAGKLYEAMRLVEQMPTPVSPHTWCALLAGSRIHHNIEVGEFAARNLNQLDPDHSGYHQLLSSLYAFDGKWEDVAEVGSRVQKQKVRKLQGYSSVEVDGGIFSFSSGDRSHIQWERMQEVLKKLEVEMRRERYFLDTNYGMLVMGSPVS